MAASKTQMNNRSVTFTPTSGSATVITRVSGSSLDTGGEIQKFSGDADRYSSVVVNSFSDPKISFTSADFAGLQANSVGTRGTVSYIMKDARNQSASSAAGDITIMMSTAVIENITFSQPHRQFGTGTISFAAESSDGQTSPLSLTIA